MRLLAAAAAVAASLLAVSAAEAQQISSGGPGNGPSTSNFEGPWSVRGTGIRATTPSRMERSRREMNRGREQVWQANMTPSQIHGYAESALRRGGFRCTIAEAIMIAQLSDGTPIVEVACQGTGGLIIADTNPLQATDCLDLTVDGGFDAGNRGRIGSCTLPSNVASVAATQN